nr:glycerophosphodiester phosphodiesterase [uncultured Agathobaculum sp.]
MSSKTLITAHSGADGTPDNSMEFVRYALTLPVDAFEVDVRRCADGTLSLGHDSTGSDAPSLRQVFDLAAAHPSIKVNCDLKEPGLERDVCRLAQQCGLAGRLILSGTVRVDALDDLPDTPAPVEVYLNLEEYVPDLYNSYRDIPDFECKAAETICGICAAHGIRVVNMNQSLVTRRFRDHLAQAGIGVSAWTVDWPEEMRWFFSRGVHNLTTRRPKAALALREKIKRDGLL